VTTARCGNSNVSLTGAEYLAALEAQGSDRRSRAAFQQLALSLARGAGHVLDFGCGPGVDARVYAEHGITVSAYDIDAAMCAHFRGHCATAMERGQVRLLEGSYEGFLSGDLRPRAPCTLITANFAPLNLVPDVHALFGRFAALLEPGGQVLASLLNPYHLGDLRFGWWWRNLPALLAGGESAVRGAQARITRMTTRRLCERAAPWFALEASFADHPREGSRSGLPPRATRPQLTSRYQFVLLRLVVPPR
jgi:SAM-dependent methyltransferase